MNDQDPPVFDAKEFNDWANRYDEDIKAETGFPFEGFSAVMDEIIRCANAAPGQRVLDLGTGTGELAIRFIKLGCEVTGTDFSTEMLKIARQKSPQVEFQFQDLRQPWPIELNSKYDLVVSAYVFHHFSPHKKVEMIQEIASHLAVNGLIIIGDLSFENPHHLDEARRHYGDSWDEELFWVAAELIPALKQAGLNVSYKQISYCAGVYCITPKKE